MHAHVCLQRVSQKKRGAGVGLLFIFSTKLLVSHIIPYATRKIRTANVLGVFCAVILRVVHGLFVSTGTLVPPKRLELNFEIGLFVVNVIPEAYIDIFELRAVFDLVS